jgi:hypothetical protein
MTYYTFGIGGSTQHKALTKLCYRHVIFLFLSSCKLRPTFEQVMCPSPWLFRYGPTQMLVAQKLSIMIHGLQKTTGLSEILSHIDSMKLVLL